MSAPEHLRTLANIRAQLEADGFSFHEGGSEGPAEHFGLAGMWWYCWCGPRGNWDAESGASHDTEAGAIAEAAMAYATYLTEYIIRPVIAAARTTAANDGAADAIQEISEVLIEQLGVSMEPGEEPDERNCAHQWTSTGTADGGDDPRFRGEGRTYCLLCGQDGDA